MQTDWTTPLRLCSCVSFSKTRLYRQKPLFDAQFSNNLWRNKCSKGELATKNSYFSKIHDAMCVRTMMLRKTGLHSAWSYSSIMTLVLSYINLIVELCYKRAHDWSLRLSQITKTLLCAWLLFVCLFVLLLYVPSQQLWSWRDGQFT